MEHARIVFQPDGEAAPSTATTDEHGRYELIYSTERNGAVVGTHTVMISTYKQLPGGRESPERVPLKYNEETELERDVVAGENVFDFDL